mmetsp:Transcript_11159/g.25743  ORF Transcript_11159/g.25743 Transcript_11159/m.25743 type:complete len:93 (+) Transcript_11159:146-424(+)
MSTKVKCYCFEHFSRGRRGTFSSALTTLSLQARMRSFISASEAGQLLPHAPASYAVSKMPAYNEASPQYEPHVSPECDAARGAWSTLSIGDD